MNYPQIQRPARVLMTADTVGGVWTYALELIRAFEEHDVTVALATMGALLTPDQRHEVRRLANIEVYESRFKLEWMENPWADLSRASDWLLQLEQRTQPNVIHLNSYVFGSLPWRARTVVVGHSCVLSWWEAVKGEPAPSEWDRYRLLVGHGLRSADAVVAPSFTMLAALDHHYGPLSTGEVIPNGRDAARFARGPKSHFILSAGRLWDEAKNVQALSGIAGELPWPVYVAGDEVSPAAEATGGKRTAKAATPTAAGQRRGLVRLGRLHPDELARWYAGASIYVLPARYEPFGLSVLEAALSGCALVLGDIPSLREIWEETAVYVPPDDPEALHMALVSLIEDPNRRIELAERAWRRAIDFTPERMAAAYVSVYSDIMMVKIPNALDFSTQVA